MPRTVGTPLRVGIREPPPAAVMEAGASEALAGLLVLDRLEVGPPRVERRGVSMPYVAVVADERAETELQFRYQEDVLRPHDPVDANLATLLGAQVALNYGLFCRELVIRGPLDPNDRRFLASMAENTAREIFVKKFLEPNPFLTGDISRLPALRLPAYLQARTRFPDAVEEPIRDPAWSASPDGYGVLASGGKDSLLSYGLLSELGHEPHSLFVNESGRHWYTALNAHRYLSGAAAARTARVWTNSDRVFAWMLRRLPFVRQDFARIRSDEYPIRLWTVAVFLFGALLVARKKGLGRIVIGDEFDTTVRVRHAGIPHYDGLYDQSRYFDEALTRFYRRKGWPVQQMSLLRPLSELLIQKTLVERYPELQRHQMSCHATHLEAERVRPCGRCEKCRRIVAMLLAIGADPASCGYTPAQIRECLQALAERGVHQEAAAVDHVRWLLDRRGHLPAEAGDRGRERPEIARLRFHREASPLDWLPEDLRLPLFGILLQHADGAMMMRNRRWVEFDPLAPQPSAAGEFKTEIDDDFRES